MIKGPLLIHSADQHYRELTLREWILILKANAKLPEMGELAYRKLLNLTPSTKRIYS